MKFLLLLGLGFLLQCPCAIRADDPIKWGQPVHGLRMGIESSVTSITSDQEPVFTVTAQNVSTQPITLPTPDTFLLKSNPSSNDYHQLPLVPLIQETSPTPVSPALPYPDPTYSISENGKPLQEAAARVVTLAAGQSATWNAVPLEENCYVGDRLPPGDKTTIQRWHLLPGGRYDIRFQFGNEQARVAGVGVWTGKLESGVVHLEVSAPSAEGIKLEGGFSLPKQRYFYGEPMQVAFTVTNKGDSPIEFPIGGDYRDTGRDGRFSFHAVDEHGEAVPDPVKRGGMGGGLGSSVRINPGESHTEKLLINHWCAFAGPGKYSITCKRILNVARCDQRKPDFYSLAELKLPSVPMETTLTVTVENDPAALTTYLATLVPGGQKRPAPLLDSSVYEQLACLALAQNPAAFPIIVKLLDGPPEVQTMSVQWLSSYGSNQTAPILVAHWSTLEPQARQMALFILNNWNATGIEPLLAAALRDRNPELRANAVLLCSNKWYGICVPILLTMGDDPGLQVRRYLGRALGASGDKRAIPVLFKLLHESDPQIEMEAAEGLGKFKRRDGVPVMIALLRDPRARDVEGNVMQTLKDLTGQDFHDNHNSWLDWWKKTGRSEYEKF